MVKSALFIDLSPSDTSSFTNRGNCFANARSHLGRRSRDSELLEQFCQFSQSANGNKGNKSGIVSELHLRNLENLCLLLVDILNVLLADFQHGRNLKQSYTKFG